MLPFEQEELQEIGEGQRAVIAILVAAIAEGDEDCISESVEALLESTNQIAVIVNR
jgi:hypothetical protein